MRPWALLALLSAALTRAADAPPDLFPLPLVLPTDVRHGDMPLGWPDDVDPTTEVPDPQRTLPLVPRGIAQVALHRPVTSGRKAYFGSLDLITDGDKEAKETSTVELRAKAQWVRIDLGEPREIWDIVIWHFHLEAIAVHDVVVQVSDDPEFATGVTTLFNNDRDNSSGQGVGADREYWESYLGRIVGGRRTKARYVRLWSRGSTYYDSLNRYTEVEVWGL